MSPLCLHMSPLKLQIKHMSSSCLQASTSGRLHSDFVSLLFLQVHRETDRFFAGSVVPLTQHDRDQFHYCHVVFSSQLKSKCGHLPTKDAVLRIILNIDGALESLGEDAVLRIILNIDGTLQSLGLKCSVVFHITDTHI
jgi:hypothetical protein